MGKFLFVVTLISLGIRSEEAIRGYPDRNLPTVLVYYKGIIFEEIVVLTVQKKVMFESSLLEYQVLVENLLLKMVLISCIN